MPETKIIPRSQLMEPPQPLRMGMDEQALGELAESLSRHGQLFPLIVIPTMVHVRDVTCQDGDTRKVIGEVMAPKFEIVDGHRRYLAAGIAGIENLECKIFPTLEDAKFGVMLDANMMREDVTPAEEGVQFVELAEKRGWTMPQLMRYFGRSEAYINERAKLVTDYPDVMQHVAARAINWTQAKAVMRCPDKNWRAYMLDQAVTHGASSRTIVGLVDQWKSMKLAKDSQQPVHTPEHNVVAAAAELPACIWCGRTDDPVNLVHVTCHSYHVRDLREFLARTGINQVASSTPGA